jgi:membrane-bound lytic murein transglycosylase MltF
VNLARVAALAAIVLLSFFILSCNKSHSTSGAQATAGKPDTLGSEVLLPEGFSNEVTAAVGQLVLPTSFGRQTGDLDQMLQARNIRALVTISPISFFYSHGKPRGLLYEQLEQLQQFVNRKFKNERRKVRVSFIPMRPDELGPALSQGVGDFVAADIVITPARHRHYEFTSPIMSKVNEIVVTGAELGNARRLDDLVGTDIYVNPLTSFSDNLIKLNADRAKAGKPALSVKLADNNLQEDDLIEMVNAGLIRATVATQHKADIWKQILPNIKVHPEIVIASGEELGWVTRKDSPRFNQLLSEFNETHGQGTLIGNTLLRRYLRNTKWVRDSTSAADMKKFSRYVEYFKKYSAEYDFDYLMIMAQGYQESGLDQNKRSPIGAIGIMQVIPKYAAAAPINVPDVSRADRNILASVRMLNNIVVTYFNDSAIDAVNKTLFTFASYNAGPSRIARLRKKAREDRLNPNKWFGNVELEAAEDIGEETVTYVANIYKYYIAYKLATERKLEVEKARTPGT